MTEEEAEAAVAAHYGMLLGIQSPWRAKLEMARKPVDIEVEHRLAGRCVARNASGSVRATTMRFSAWSWRHLDVR